MTTFINLHRLAKAMIWWKEGIETIHKTWFSMGCSLLWVTQDHRSREW